MEGCHEALEELTLRVTDAGDGAACDHADWADARVTSSTV